MTTPAWLQALDDMQPTDRVKALRTDYFRARPQICAERPRWVTDAHRQLNLSVDELIASRRRITPLEKAQVYAALLFERKPIVHHASAIGHDGKPFETSGWLSRFAGSTTSHYKGVLVYPELFGLALWPELWSIHRRKANPYHLSAEDRKTLDLEVFPYWVDRSILELTRRRHYPNEILSQGFTPTMLLQFLSLFATAAPNCVSHTIPDFRRAVCEGLGAIAADARERGRVAKTEEQRDFYEAMAVVLAGVIRYSERLAAEARKMAAAEPEGSGRRIELEELAEIHARVPREPARTFREGLTTVWMCWTALHQESANAALSLGRLDQLLYPLYAADLAAGRLTVARAVELVSCLWLKIGDHVPAVPKAGEELFGGTGSNQAITLGGVDRDGNDAVNELSYVMLRSTEHLRLRDPNLNARVHPKNPPLWLQRVCRANAETRATPALHNDEAVIAMLRERGTATPDAFDYGVVGCVEPVSAGRSYTFSGAIQVNLAAVLELALFQGTHRSVGQGRLLSLPTRDPAKLKTFGELRDEFLTQLRWMADTTTRLNDQLETMHRDAYPLPLLSALFEGPMDKGRDLTAGSARYDAAGVTIIGFADVADSLSALEKHVFGPQATVPWETLRGALAANWEGHEALRRLLLNPEKTPKYGRDDGSGGDRMAAWLLATLDEAFCWRETKEGRRVPRPTVRGGFYRVGYWTMTNHAAFGRLMKATPDGRAAEAPFASGITPVSAAAKDLPATIAATAALESARYVSNGMALNLKFPAIPVTDNVALGHFVAYVKRYFERQGTAASPRPGGMEVQFNLYDQAQLLVAAKGAPGADQMLVRVSGYTAYFKDLNPKMQQEIIERTMYDLATGQVVAGLRFDLAPDPTSGAK
jgi:formate C-acetyltransferase